MSAGCRYCGDEPVGTCCGEALCVPCGDRHQEEQHGGGRDGGDDRCPRCGRLACGSDLLGPLRLPGGCQP